MYAEYVVAGSIFHGKSRVQFSSSDLTMLPEDTIPMESRSNVDSSDKSDTSSLADSNYSSDITDYNELLDLVEDNDRLGHIDIKNTLALADRQGLVDSNEVSIVADTFIYTEPLIGLPASILVDGISTDFGCFIPARRAAIAYCLSVRISPSLLPRSYAKIDINKNRRIASLYEQLPHAPHDELTQSSYLALADETLAQWRIIKATGLQVEYNPIRTGAPDPYSNPRRLILDVIQNNHLFVTATRNAYGDTSFELDPLNPLLAEVPGERISGEVPMVNDLLRVVHDYFGHVREGLGFRSEGEYNAWRGHIVMFSKLAGRALTMELRGQACWINHGPFGAINRLASINETKYPPQKLNLLPIWVSEDSEETP